MRSNLEKKPALVSLVRGISIQLNTLNLENCGPRRADLLAAGLLVASGGRLAAGLGAVPVAPSVSGTRFAK